MDEMNPQFNQNADGANRAIRMLGALTAVLMVGGAAVAIIAAMNPEQLGTFRDETFALVTLEAPRWGLIFTGSGMFAFGFQILVGLGFFWGWRYERRQVATHATVQESEREREARRVEQHAAAAAFRANRQGNR